MSDQQTGVVPARVVGYVVDEIPPYVPAPLADGQARVVLEEVISPEGDVGYIGMVWRDYNPAEEPISDVVFDVPAATRDRWRQITDAYEAVEDEIRAMVDARRAELMAPYLKGGQAAT